MFLLFTPYTFMFLAIYFIFLIFMFSINNFYIYWVFMEFMMLLFLGLSFTIFSNSYTFLMMYFLIQTISSFLIFLSYLYSSSLLMTLSIMLKLSMFPFLFWFINVVYRFPNFILFLCSSFHKIPVIYMLSIFNLCLNNNLLWFSFIFSSVLAGSLMVNVSEIRLLFVLSSVANNSWFILTQTVSSFMFLCFFVFYSFSLYFIILKFKSFSKLSFSFHNYFSLNFWVTSISGLPPFPIFFVKIYIIFSLFFIYSYSLYLIFFLLSTLLVLAGYISFLFKFNIYFLMNQSALFLSL